MCVHVCVATRGALGRARPLSQPWDRSSALRDARSVFSRTRAAATWHRRTRCGRAGPSATFTPLAYCLLIGERWNGSCAFATRPCVERSRRACRSRRASGGRAMRPAAAPRHAWPPQTLASTGVGLRPKRASRSWPAQQCQSCHQVSHARHKRRAQESAPRRHGNSLASPAQTPRLANGGDERTHWSVASLTERCAGTESGRLRTDIRNTLKLCVSASGPFAPCSSRTFGDSRARRSPQGRRLTKYPPESLTEPYCVPQAELN